MKTVIYNQSAISELLTGNPKTIQPGREPKKLQPIYDYLSKAEQEFIEMAEVIRLGYTEKNCPTRLRNAFDKVDELIGKGLKEEDRIPFYRLLSDPITVEICLEKLKDGFKIELWKCKCQYGLRLVKNRAHRGMIAGLSTIIRSNPDYKHVADITEKDIVKFQKL